MNAAIRHPPQRKGLWWGLITSRRAKTWPRYCGRVAFAYVQGANPKAGAHLGFALDVIRARLRVIGGKRTKMRITLGGLYTLNELQASFERLTQWLRLNEIEEIKGVNVYLQPLRDRRSVELVDEFGDEVAHLMLDGPRQKAVRAIAIIEPQTERAGNENRAPGSSGVE